jgi:hypothetical protein
MRENRGPEMRLKQLAGEALRAAERLPVLLSHIEKAAARMAGDGIAVSSDSLSGLGRGRSQHSTLVWVLCALVVALTVVLVLTL